MVIKNRRLIIGFLISVVFLTQEACKDAKDPKAAAQTDASTDQKSPFEDHVRTTEFQTPEQELAGFKLPEGFEITLFAAEPEIGKPINMEFDERGRLWVTQSSAYPMAAAPDSGRDRITILEDNDGDGRADKFTPFADDLNIPIGIMPMQYGAIGYSIPNLYRFKDNNKDGKYDSKEVLLGPFGFKDTHGMVSNLIRGFDGWIHSCHGFTNTSTIAGTDGDSVTMTSGNTFRFKPDGSRVEQTTYGRVNPFGYAFDEWGYLYSVDCHSKPIYQLINGAEYPHFGKRSPAMGFAPEMMGYELGSTALSGLVYYTGQQFPEEYQHSFFNGDVVTCRINRNTISYNGSSPESKRQEDFLISADPWFRPVDIKTAPDGSMYIADFYNRIIGHYEVPLDHPLRDRTSGRIWKITYKGKNKSDQAAIVNDLSKAAIDDLVKALNYPQLSTRLKIANQLVDVHQEKAVAPVKKMMTAEAVDSKSFIQGLWILYRLKALPDDLMQKALTHKDPMVQVHALRVLAEEKSLQPWQHTAAINALNSTNANVQRLAAEVLEHTTGIDNLKVLLAVYNNAAEKDTHLKYTALISLRDNLRNKEVLRQFASQQWTEPELAVIMKTMPDVPLEEAAVLTLKYLQTHDIDKDKLPTYLEYVSRYVSGQLLEQTIPMIRNKFRGDTETQYNVYTRMRQGIAQKGGNLTAGVKAWGTEIAKEYLKTVGDEKVTWKNYPFSQSTDIRDPWQVNNNFNAGQAAPSRLLVSEIPWIDPTGTVRSPVFSIPAKLQVTVFDNELMNTPEDKGVSNNTFRIRLEKTGQILAEYRAKSDTPMAEKDMLQHPSFDLKKYEGQSGYIEVTDSAKLGVIGIADLKPEVVKLPVLGSGQIAKLQIQGAEIAADIKTAALEPILQKLLATTWAAPMARIAAADALMAISPTRNTSLTLKVFSGPDEIPTLREKLATVLGQSTSPAVLTGFQNALSGAPRNVQVSIAMGLASSSQGINRLLAAVKQGKLGSEVLMDLKIQERLSSNMKGKQSQELKTLTAGNAREDRKELIQSRLKDFNPAAVTAETGKALFVQNCSMCHQIKGSGGMIGPQLDGIGNWGQKALTEKILDPNRNISQAFRNYNITLQNGKSLSGLYRREEGEVLIFANLGGQEFSVRKADIKERKASQYTLMPDNFRNTISKKDFDALLKYLLTIKE